MPCLTTCNTCRTVVFDIDVAIDKNEQYCLYTMWYLATSCICQRAKQLPCFTHLYYRELCDLTQTGVGQHRPWYLIRRQGSNQLTYTTKSCLPTHEVFDKRYCSTKCVPVVSYYFSNCGSCSNVVFVANNVYLESI